MTISIEETQKSLPALIDALSPGEEILITRNNEPVAQLVAVEPAHPTPVFGNCSGMLAVLVEDEEHLKDFKDYMP